MPNSAECRVLRGTPEPGKKLDIEKHERHNELFSCLESHAQLNMFTYDQFVVNEAWIVVKVNDAHLFVKDDAYDMYVIFDAGSTYVLGHALSKVSEGFPQEEDVEAIFKKGWEAKQQWPKKLMLTDKSSAENIFKIFAEKNNIAIEYVSLSSLAPLVNPLKDSFSSFFNGYT
ncbi:MAG: hypothetical protein GY862_23135 [Gammaproteobacteria bacterium]|nr:hypothetical protein [Gammaproteobacteria bacterium]